MTTSSDDDDDDLFQHVGLSVRKQKAANRKRDHTAQFLHGLLEENNQQRARRARCSAVKLEENDVETELAEAALTENLQSMKDRSRLSKEKKAELKSKTLEESARDVGQSSLVGCRVGVIGRHDDNSKDTKKKKKNQDTSSWKRLVSKANLKKYAMVRFLSENSSLLHEILTSKVLLSKFPMFPPPVLEWLWDAVLLLDHNKHNRNAYLQDAAFETLHEYVLMGNNININATDTLLQTYQTHFGNATTADEHDKHDALADLQHFLDLQKCMLEQQGTIHNVKEASLLLQHVSIACLDVNFHGNRVSRSWRSFVSVLLDLVQSTLDDADKWRSWQRSTSQDIVAFIMSNKNLPGTPYKMNDGDEEEDDDEEEASLQHAQLSQAVLVRMMVLVNAEFGAILAQESWNQLVPKPQDGVVDKELPSLAVNVLTDAVTTFHALNRIPDMQGAHILSSCQCLVSGISAAWTFLQDDDDKTHDIVWKGLDSELTQLANRLRKLSIRHGHFRRAEIVISSQLRGRVTQELQDASSAKKVQSSLQQWMKK